MVMTAMFRFLWWAGREIAKAYRKWKAEQEQRELLLQSPADDSDDLETPNEHVNGNTWECKRCNRRNAQLYKVMCLWCGCPRP